MSCMIVYCMIVNMCVLCRCVHVPSVIVSLTIDWPVLLVGTPTELSWLLTLLNIALNRPSVDELLIVLDDSARCLGITLRDVDRLDIQLLSQVNPSLAGCWYSVWRVGILRNVQETLLYEVRYETWIGTVCDQGSWTILLKLLTKLQCLLTESIVRTLGSRNIWIGVTTGPWLIAGIHVQDILLLAVLDECARRDINRQVDEEVTLTDILLEVWTVVVLSQLGSVEGDAIGGGMVALLLCVSIGDDDQLAWLHVDMAKEQWQAARADSAETEDDDLLALRHLDVLGVLRVVVVIRASCLRLGGGCDEWSALRDGAQWDSGRDASGGDRHGRPHDRAEGAQACIAEGGGGALHDCEGGMWDGLSTDGTVPTVPRQSAAALGTAVRTAAAPIDMHRRQQHKQGRKHTPIMRGG